jgi:hypothetical protein
MWMFPFGDYQSVPLRQAGPPSFSPEGVGRATFGTLRILPQEFAAHNEKCPK